MSDSLTEFLSRFAMAKGDPHVQAVTAAEFALTSYPNSMRESLHKALDAAAVLRWFDDILLGELLQLPSERVRTLFGTLTLLPFVETHPARQGRAFNVHELTRLGWRKRLARERPEYFRDLSKKASASFVDDRTAVGRINWIYYLLSADPDTGATELQKLDREWTSSAPPEDREALATTLKELLESDLLSARPLLWALLCIAWVQVDRGEASQLEACGRDSLRLACETKDQAAEADAQCLVGDALEAQGKLESALKAFERYLSISRMLVERDHKDITSRQQVAFALARIGNVLRAQNIPDKSLAAFQEALSIVTDLADRDPTSLGKQRELALMHCRLGEVFEEIAELNQANLAFSEYLRINKKLAEGDKLNLNLQRGLAMAYGKIAGVAEKQSNLASAQHAFEQYLSIMQLLAGRDPSNLGWQRDLAIAHGRLGGILEKRGKFKESRPAFEENSRIIKSLSRADPANAGWQRDSAVASARLARLYERMGEHNSAIPLYAEAVEIFRDLRNKGIGPTKWDTEMALIESKLAQCRIKTFGGSSD